MKQMIDSATFVALPKCAEIPLDRDCINHRSSLHARAPRAQRSDKVPYSFKLDILVNISHLFLWPSIFFHSRHSPLVSTLIVQSPHFSALRYLGPWSLHSKKLIALENFRLSMWKERCERNKGNNGTTVLRRMIHSTDGEEQLAHDASPRCGFAVCESDILFRQRYYPW